MLNKESVSKQVKYEGCQDEITKLTQGNQDLMILISEANKVKRE